jgi:hypothetical protein
MSIVIEAETHPMTQRNLLIFRYYLDHSIKECAAHFKLSKSTIGRAILTSARSLNIDRATASAEHEENLRHTRIHPNLKHCRPDDLRGKNGHILPKPPNSGAPQAKSVTVENVMKLVNARKAREAAARNNEHNIIIA